MTDARRSERKVPIITGPTGGGKTSLVLMLKERFPELEVVSADSRQVYRRLDIGTAKPTPAERRALPHHLIDVVEPTETYSAGAFRADAERAITSCFERGALPVVVGGTGFYLRSLTEGLSPIPQVSPEVREGLERRLDLEGLPGLYAELERVDPEAARGIDPTDPQRTLRALSVWESSDKRLSEWWRVPAEPPMCHYVWLGLSWERAALRRRIADRTAGMLRRGLREEVASLRTSGLGWEYNAMRTVGYREWKPYFDGEATGQEVSERITIHTAQYAKRQMTWFSSVEAVSWLDAQSPSFDGDAAEWLRGAVE